MRTVRSHLKLAALLLLAAACTSWHPQRAPVPQVLERNPKFVRLTLQDHSQVEMSGPKLVDDSLIGQANGRRAAIPLSDVSGIALRQGDSGASFGILFLLGAVAVAVIAAGSAAGSD